MRRMRVGIYDHFGWAVAVTADDDHEVVDRRRLELVEEGVTPAPIHYDAAQHDDASLTALLATVRASVLRAAAIALDELPSGIESISLRTWPPDFPTDLATVRRSPWEARADAVMYRQLLAELAQRRGWEVHTYEAKTVEAQATALLGLRADPVLKDVRKRLGPPWSKDHRLALAATVLAAS
jgi:hypothetical protein